MTNKQIGIYKYKHVCRHWLYQISPKQANMKCVAGSFY